MSTGANLENTSLSWLDKMDSLGDGTVAAQNAVLATSVEQMLGDLRGTYQKIVKSDGKFGNYEAKQLQNRIENTTELLPPAARKRLTAIYERDLAVANELGKEAGVDLDKQLNNRSEAQKANAAPNVPGQKAAGRRLRVFWEQENSKMTDRVRSLTQQAALQGKSWRSLSLQIRELLIEEQKQGTESERSKRVNKKYGINGRAELIARTEMANAFVQGKIDEMRRMGYEFARWSAAGERTCGYCMSRDGLVYKIEEVEGSIPAHPRCRCSLIPVEMSAEMKKNGPTGPGAADELDDAYWTKSRNDKLSQWKQENRGIRDPKTEALLNQMLRNYARTPTNTQNYLRPGSEAPKPFWAPSGQTIPDLERVGENTQEAANKAKASEKKRLEDEAAEALKAAEAEAKRIAKQKADEEARQLAEAEEIQRKAIAKIAELSKKYKLPEYEIQRAMNEARKQNRIYGADKQATFELLIKQAQQSQKAVAGFNDKVSAKDHFIPTKSKQYVNAKMLDEAFEAHRKMPGQAGENFRKLEAFMNKHDIQMMFSNPANNPKKFNMKKYNQLKEDWDAIREHPNFQRSVAKGDQYWNQSEKIQQQFGSNHARWMQDSASTNPYSGRAYMTGGGSRAAGFTSGGADFVAVADWSGHKRIGAKEVDKIRKGYERNFERVDNNHNLNWSARGDAPLGSKMGSKGQTEDGWVGTLIHELGHQVHYRGGLKRLDGDNINPGRFDPTRKNRPGEWEASQYGTTNQLENFAETFTQWVYQPDKLKRYSPEAYKWVDDHVRNALSDNWR